MSDLTEFETFTARFSIEHTSLGTYRLCILQSEVKDEQGNVLIEALRYEFPISDPRFSVPSFRYNDQAAGYFVRLLSHQIHKARSALERNRIIATLYDLCSVSGQPMPGVRGEKL